MAVLAKWICDRDDSMFDSKKEAEAHDKVLELAEQFTALLMSKIPEVNEHKAEEFGIFLANNKEAVIEACKGKAEALIGINTDSDKEIDSAEESHASTEENNVTPLLAEA